MRKVKEYVQSKALKVGVVLATAIPAVTAVANASDVSGSDTVTTALTTGFTQMKADAMSVIATIIPIAITVAGAIFVTKKGMSWFKSLAK